MIKAIHIKIRQCLCSNNNWALLTHVPLYKLKPRSSTIHIFYIIVTVSANGYCRSEAVSVIYLQKAKDARRIYATVIHTKSNCDGFKEEGITFPSGAQQQRLLQEIYDECQVVPSTVGWLEAHATGTKVSQRYKTCLQSCIS